MQSSQTPGFSHSAYLNNYPELHIYEEVAMPVRILEGTQRDVYHLCGAIAFHLPAVFPMPTLSIYTDAVAIDDAGAMWQWQQGVVSRFMWLDEEMHLAEIATWRDGSEIDRTIGVICRSDS